MVFGNLFKSSTLKPDKPEVGIARALRGNLGLWAIWDENTYSTELYRISVKALTKPIEIAVFSFTFAPARAASLVQYVEFPCSFKELLRGKNRAKDDSQKHPFPQGILE